MSSYSDQPQINALYEEQEKVLAALALVDAGGTLSSFIVSGPPQPPPASAPAPDPLKPNPRPPVPAMAPVNIFLPGPAAAGVMRQIEAQLNQRSDEINAQLAALGVVGTPTREVKP